MSLLTKVGRPTLHGVAMTGSERVKRCRAKKAAETKLDQLQHLWRTASPEQRTAFRRWIDKEA